MSLPIVAQSGPYLSAGNEENGLTPALDAKRVDYSDPFVFGPEFAIDTLQGTNISPKNGILKMIFLFPRWDMLIPWRVMFL